jgi:hypothetical protein
MEKVVVEHYLSALGPQAELLGWRSWDVAVAVANKAV